jgi:hypothetical protein
MNNKLTEGSKSDTGYAVNRYNRFVYNLIEITQFGDDLDGALEYQNRHGGHVVELTSTMSWKVIEPDSK